MEFIRLENRDYTKFIETYYTDKYEVSNNISIEIKSTKIPLTYEFNDMPAWLQKRVYSGIPLEIETIRAAQEIGERIIKQNNFDPQIYVHQYGTDIITWNFIIECKNNKATTFLNDKIMNDTIDDIQKEAIKYPNKIKVIVIANQYKNKKRGTLNYSKRVATRLSNLKINVIESGCIYPKHLWQRRYVVSTKLGDLLAANRNRKTAAKVNRLIFGAKVREHNIIEGYFVRYLTEPLQTKYNNILKNRYQHTQITLKDKVRKLQSIKNKIEYIINRVKGLASKTISKITNNTKIESIDNKITDSKIINKIDNIVVDNNSSENRLCQIKSADGGSSSSELSTDFFQTIKFTRKQFTHSLKLK